MTIKTKTLYEVREYPTPTDYSVSLGRRLRTRKDAQRVTKILKKRGRDVFIVPWRVNLPSYMIR